MCKTNHPTLQRSELFLFNFVQSLWEAAGHKNKTAGIALHAGRLQSLSVSNSIFQALNQAKVLFQANCSNLKKLAVCMKTAVGSGRTAQDQENFDWTKTKFSDLGQVCFSGYLTGARVQFGFWRKNLTERFEMKRNRRLSFISNLEVKFFLQHPNCKSAPVK